MTLKHFFSQSAFNTEIKMQGRMSFDNVEHCQHSWFFIMVFVWGEPGGIKLCQVLYF